MLISFRVQVRHVTPKRMPELVKTLLKAESLGLGLPTGSVEFRVRGVVESRRGELGS